MNIEEVYVEKTNNKGEYDKEGRNWFIVFKFSNDKKFAFEIKPEMNLSEIVFELVKFSNLIITKVKE